jgi:hypothetical protein
MKLEMLNIGLVDDLKTKFYAQYFGLIETELVKLKADPEVVWDSVNLVEIRDRAGYQLAACEIHWRRRDGARHHGTVSIRYPKT